MLFKMFMLSAIIAQTAWAVGTVFGIKGWGMALAVISLILMCLFWFGSGIIAGISQLERTPVVRCADGKGEVRYTLKLGPFGYTVVIPEAGKDARE